MPPRSRPCDAQGRHAPLSADPVFGGRGGATVPELFTLGGWLAAHRIVCTVMLIVLGFRLITGLAMVKPAHLVPSWRVGGLRLWRSMAL